MANKKGNAKNTSKPQNIQNSQENTILNNVVDAIKEEATTWGINKARETVPTVLSTLWNMLISKINPLKSRDVSEIENLLQEFIKEATSAMDIISEQYDNSVETLSRIYAKKLDLTTKVCIETGYNIYEAKLFEILKKQNMPAKQIIEISDSIRSQINSQINSKAEMDKEFEEFNAFVKEEQQKFNAFVKEEQQKLINNIPVTIQPDEFDKFNRIFQELTQGMKDSGYDYKTTIDQIHFMCIEGRITESQEAELVDYYTKEVFKINA